MPEDIPISLFEKSIVPDMSWEEFLSSKQIDWANVVGEDMPEDNANKREIFAQNDAPTGNFKEGDLWFDTDDSNKIYRANSALSWVSVVDGTIAGKVTTFAQASIPTSLAIGDLWIDTNDGNKLYRAASIGADQITAGEWILVTDTVVDDGTSPANPSGLTATAGIQAVFLKWDWNTETDMDHYDVYRHTADDSGASSKIASVKVNMMFDSGLTAGTPYYYWIKAIDRKGNASGFNAVGGTTATPRNVGESDVSDDAITAGKINVANLAAIVADLGAITAGTIVMPTTGYIRGGQTDYNTGTGFFLGYSGAAYKFSVGNPAGKYIAWDGSDFAVNGFVLSSKGVFGGDGSDGDLSVTGTTTLNDTPTDGIKIYNYDDLTIGASGVLTTGANLKNCIVILKVKGNLTVTNGGKIDLKGKGAAGGTGKDRISFGAGGAGTTGLLFLDTLTHYGSGGGGINGDSAGGGGGGSINNGVDGSKTGGGATAGAKGVAIASQILYMNQGFKTFYVCPGSGGGGGGFGATVGSSGVGGGNGGDGGGAIIIEVAGNITVGASNWIDITGNNGQDGQCAGDYSSGGGGGAGGMALVLYNGTLTGAGVVTTTASSGGAPSGVAHAAAGGAGSAGAYRIQQNLMFV